MSRQRYFAEAVRESQVLLARYLVGFDDSNHTRQAPGLPNHVAWTLGHLALVLYRHAEKLDGQPIPEAEFVKGGGRAGNAKQFDIDAVSFGSAPSTDASLYPAFARCVEIFNAAIERFASAFHNATDAKLDSPTAWGAIEIAHWKLATRAIFHNGTHTGQIADLRRALGMGSALGGLAPAKTK